MSRQVCTVCRMEASDALRSRRNVRAYADASIPEERLARILEAGRRRAFDDVVHRERW